MTQPRTDWTRAEIAALFDLPFTELVFRAATVHRAHALHDRDDRGQVAVLGVAPRGAHAEPLAAVVLGLRRRLQHRLHIHQFGRLDPAVGVNRLTAIAAILGAAAGLDAEQGAQLDLIGRVMRAVDGRGAEHQ